MERQTTQFIAGQTSLHKSLFPQREKSRIAIKPTVPYIEPNKFHKYVCFGGRKTREERNLKSALKFTSSAFLTGLWLGPRQRPLAGWLSSSILIRPFKIWGRAQRPLALAVKFNLFFFAIGDFPIQFSIYTSCRVHHVFWVWGACDRRLLMRCDTALTAYLLVGTFWSLFYVFAKNERQRAFTQGKEARKVVVFCFSQFP